MDFAALHPVPSPFISCISVWLGYFPSDIVSFASSFFSSCLFHPEIPHSPNVFLCLLKTHLSFMIPSNPASSCVLHEAWLALSTDVVSFSFNNLVYFASCLFAYLFLYCFIVYLCFFFLLISPTRCKHLAFSISPSIKPSISWMLETVYCTKLKSVLKCNVCCEKLFLRCHRWVQPPMLLVLLGRAIGQNFYSHVGTCSCKRTEAFTPWPKGHTVSHSGECISTRTSTRYDPVKDSVLEAWKGMITGEVQPGWRRLSLPSNIWRVVMVIMRELDSEMLLRTKLGPVGGNYQEADFSPILEHSNNCHSSSVEGAAWKSGKLPKWSFLNTGCIISWLWECQMGGWASWPPRPLLPIRLIDFMEICICTRDGRINILHCTAFWMLAKLKIKKKKNSVAYFFAFSKENDIGFHLGIL